jgi:hypothetical protein
MVLLYTIMLWLFCTLGNSEELPSVQNPPGDRIDATRKSLLRNRVSRKCQQADTLFR